MEDVATKETLDLFNDLIRVNNDRIAAYMKALEALKPEDADLNILFVRNIDQSRRFRRVLVTELQALGGDLDIDDSLGGSIYKMWANVTPVAENHSRRAILAGCIFGEDTAQKAYETALESPHLPLHMATTLFEEKQLMEIARDQVRVLRDHVSPA
ncbi:PA2169 family four-helix-bundle protein [Dinghuibacter silviterrae]|uniref:Uncharacterized protein (TIGR02284 family) n=1 Tax=Dinghuibacter silviterrae TaxID=1539049 RepID=A0A4R8DH56_9BACT|nr:PA2169 family four-helix-bundle protein [Dinghuibacter silviterrae]TDW96564.1 uncharacterized protein (TIGR02284 family) [Dinghuibacter silviterrae]